MVPHAQSLQTLTPNPARVLLIHTHAVDIRLPWYRWHQPTGLLQVGSALKRQGCDVRLIDCLGWDGGQRPRRRKVGSLAFGDQRADLWQYGGLWGHLTTHIRTLKKEGWTPDQVFVSCPQTTWWQAAHDLIQRLKRDWFPGVPVVLGGVYPSLEPDHAAQYSGADVIVAGSIPEARDEIPDLRLYDPAQRPSFAGLYLYRSQSVTDVETETAVIPRAPEEIAQEVADKAALGVTEFAFFDDDIRLEHQLHFVAVLRAIAARKLRRTGFVAIGNLSPRLIDDELAHEMAQVNYRHVYLKCDVTHRVDGIRYDTPYEVYRSCIAALHRTGKFRPRTDAVTAMLLIGVPHEDIEALAERAIRLASIVGAVNLVQYQYSSGTASSALYAPLIARQNGHLDLTTLNCKLFPLVRLAGAPLEHYLELTRLAALLNSKYRSRTFDFLGKGIIARTVQESFRTQGWNPLDNEQPGSPADFIPLTARRESD